MEKTIRSSNGFQRIISIGILVFITLILSVSLLFGANQKYSFVRIEKLAEQEVAEKILIQIYKNIGIDANIEALPGERAKMMATEGQKDGETLRIFSYGEKNPTMVRIPTPYSSLETTVFSKKSSAVVIKNKDDLKKYKIVIVRGVQHTKDITEGLENVQIADDAELMMKMLEGGRADIAITNTIAGLGVLKKLKIDTIAPVITLETLELFHYVHQKNKDIVPKVDAEIKKMKASGELKKLRDKYEKEYLDNIK